MKRAPIFAAAFVGLCLLAAAIPTARAGRVGGPMNRNGIVPAATSVYFEIPFETGDQARVSVRGDSNSILALFLYDADGHVATGVGASNAQTVSMDVYRTGTFRLEVRNLGLRDTVYRLATN